MTDILNDVYEIYPVDSMLQECALNVTGVDNSSPKLRFKLELYARVVQKGTIYAPDQYYFTIPQDAFIKVLNQFGSSLGIQEDIDDLGDPDYNGSSSTKFENDYVWIRWTSYQLYVKIKWDKRFSNSYEVVTFDNGSYYFDLSIRLYADQYYQNINYFDVNGAVCGGQSVEINTTFTLPSTTVTAVGYRSSGWYTSRTGGAKVGDAGGASEYICLSGYDFEAYKNTELNLYEQQELIPIYVRFDANGGLVYPTSSSVSGGKSITLPTPTRDNHDFYGWYDSNTGGTKVGDAGDSYRPVSDIVLYARWKERHTVSIRDLQTEGNTYRRSYIHNMDTFISDLPSEISREGYTFRGYSLDSTEAMKIADTKGKLIPDVAGYTDSSGQYLLDSPLTLFALWERIEFKISFDANGGVIAEKDKVKTTYEGKVLDFPRTSRAGYMLSGWTEDLNAEEKTFVTESTIFSGNTSLYADWEEVKVTSEALCYLERVYEDTIQRFYLPIISNIEDTISTSLVEMDTVMFGYENRFVMDTGTRQTFSVTVERVAPVNPDDSGTDFEKFSNSKWWALFLEYINFWQNDGRAQNGERTGGFRFVYAPQEEYKGLYPTIIKNVFISGQVSVHISVDHMSFTLPLTVATMDAKASLPTWKAVFKERAGSTNMFESEEIVGSAMSLPAPDSEWVSKIQIEESKGFSHWVMESGDGALKYRPGGDLEYDSNYLTEPPVFYAVWENTSETRIYYVARGESGVTFRHQYKADADCTVEATLYGGGGTGGKGSKKNRTWPRKDYYYGGGGGGAPVPVTTSYAMKAGEILYIELGLGGNSEEYIVDEYWTPPENDGTVSRTWMYEYAKTDSTYGTKGVGGVTAGSYNGGKGGDVEDGNKMNAGEDGRGSMGGKGAEGLELKFGDSKYFAFYGGGGGGGSIPYVKREEFVCNDITYKTAYQYSNPEMSLFLNDVSIEVSSKSVFDIISKGGDGGSAKYLSAQACDARRGYADLGTDSSGVHHRAIFVAAGGGGRLNRETKSDTHASTTLPMSRGSDGFVILNIMKG